MAVNMSYPKPRSLLTKIFDFARTDNATEKCVLPKGAVVVDVTVHQQAAAVTNAGAISVGWSGAATALLNAFSLPVSTVGLAKAGAAAGASILGTPLDTDKMILATYTVGSSTAGGTGKVIISYFVPGPGETATS